MEKQPQNVSYYEPSIPEVRFSSEEQDFRPQGTFQGILELFTRNGRQHLEGPPNLERPSIAQSSPPISDPTLQALAAKDTYIHKGNRFLKHSQISPLQGLLLALWVVQCLE